MRGPDITWCCHHCFLGYMCRKLPWFLLLSSLISPWPGFSKTNLLWHRAKEAWLCRSWASTIGFRLERNTSNRNQQLKTRCQGPQKERAVCLLPFVRLSWRFHPCFILLYEQGWHPEGTQRTKRYLVLHSQKLTARTCKWMVGILLSYWGGLFSGAILVSGRVCCIFLSLHYYLPEMMDPFKASIFFTLSEVADGTTAPDKLPAAARMKWLFDFCGTTFTRVLKTK